MRRALIALCACGSAGPPAAVSNVAHPALACPAPPADRLESAGAPPWQRDPLGREPTCIEIGDGARARIEPDPSDLDGWRKFLVVEDGAGERFRVATRAVGSLAIAPDGGVVISHVEDAVSRFSPTGALVWKREHPRCGYSKVAVGYDGRVVLGCGYSLVALSADGSLQWHKWPFGNSSIAAPLLARDGTMIVRSGATVAKLDADGNIVWHVDTGWNRYVEAIGVARDGALVFVTAMDELHTPGEVRIYYEPEPDELFAVSRDGKVLARTAITGAQAWPASQPWTPALRSGRIP